MVFANGVVLASNSAVLYCFTRSKPRLKGVRWFAHGTAVAAVGMGLELLRGRAPDAVTVLLANGLFPIAWLLARRGLAEFAGCRLRLWRWDLTLLAAQTGALAYYNSIHPSIEARYIVMSLTMAAEVGLALTVLAASPEDNPLADWPAYAVLIGYCAFYLLRTVGTWMALGDAAGQNAVQFASATAQLLFTTLVALGSVWLATAAQQLQMAEKLRWDGLTGTLNRSALSAALARELEFGRRERQPVAGVALDLDHFKQINDTYGHAAGDAALRAVAGILRDSVRLGDPVARWGGEESVVVLPGQNLASAGETAERLRGAILNANFTFEGQPIPLSASFGVAVCDGAEYPASANPGQDLLRRADQALYAAKHLGRNRVAVDGSPDTVASPAPRFRPA